MFVLSAYDPSPGLEELARTDYFRALATAQAIENRPLAILAQLSVVRGAMRPVVSPAARPAPAKRAPVKRTAPAKSASAAAAPPSRPS